MLRNRNAPDDVGLLGRPPEVSPTPSIVRLRNPGLPHRGFFVSAPLVGYYHIGVAAPSMGTDQPLAPIGNGSLGAVSSRHFGGIRLDLMAALPAPGEVVWLPEGEAHYAALRLI